MRNNFTISYLDEKTFKLLERSLKKYNMISYKKLLFDIYPNLINGNFVGEEDKCDKKTNTKSFHVELPADSLFKKIYGKVILYYSVFYNDNIVCINNIEPRDLLSYKPKAELTAYKGIMISKDNAEKEKFKIDLLSRLEK